MMKKILSVLLAVCLLAVCLPLSASARTYEGSCGENAEWVLDMNTGVLTISGTGPIKDYNYFSDTPWYSYRRSVKKVVVNSGITHIGNRAFYSGDLTELTAVQLPNTVTTIGNNAFCFCKSMETCNLPDNITSIGESAFYGCKKLKLTRLPSSLTSLGESAFSECASIGPALEFPEGITNIPSRAFSECTGIRKLTLREGIENIGSWAFSETSIQKVVIPSTAKAIGEYAFRECTSLRFVDMKGGTSIGRECFYGSKALEKINLPNTLVSIAEISFSSDKFTYLYIPASVTKLGEVHCNTLKTACVVNPKCDIKSYNNLGKVGVTTIYGEPDSTAEAYAKANGYSFKLLGTQPEPPADPVINDDITNPNDPDPVDPSAPKFTDVKAGAFYADAVKWAVEKEITSGTTKTTFEPNKTCGRAEIVTFLWRANGSPKPSSTQNPFKDIKPGDYFYTAVLWANEKGITTGTGDGTTFSPGGFCTRGQAVTFMWRAAGTPSVHESTSFKDVISGAYYDDAVKWAVKNNITTGAGNNTFKPNDFCSRGQIVTFLYRGQ